MNNKPIINLFEENELNIGALYSLYAQTIPESSNFWNRLSQAEIRHASEIGNQKELNDSIVENKFLRQVVDYIMSYVLDEIKKAQQKTVSHKQALRSALRIEQSMLEKKCFDLFQLKNASLQEVFEKMNRDTERHVAILKKEMQRQKFSFEED